MPTTTITQDVIQAGVMAAAKEWEIPETAIFRYWPNARRNLRTEIALPNDDQTAIAITDDDNSVIIQHVTHAGVTIEQMTLADPHVLMLANILGAFLATVLTDLEADPLSIKLRALPTRI